MFLDWSIDPTIWATVPVKAGLYLPHHALISGCWRLPEIWPSMLQAALQANRRGASGHQHAGSLLLHTICRVLHQL